MVERDRQYSLSVLRAGSIMLEIVGGGWGRKNERVMLLLWSQLAKLYLLGRRIKEELCSTLYLCNPSNL